MTDVLLFLRQGWKHIWRQSNIFLFSSLLVVVQFLYFLTRGQKLNPILQLLFLLVVLILPYANLIGVPYIAYRFLIGEPAGSRETLHAVKTFWPRLIGFFCVVGLMISPFLLIAFFVTQNYSSTPREARVLLGEILALFSLPFGSVLDFCLFGFFRNNDDLSQGLKKTWSLFRRHFWTLSILSVVISVLFRVSLFLAAILTLLLQGDFDLTSLSEINLFNPGSLLTNNLLFLFISGVGSIILMPFSSLVYGSAYLKYTEAEKLP